MLETNRREIMELSLDLSLVYVPKTIGECLRQVSRIKDCSQKVLALDDYVKRLEDEMRKIDAFKRELPLSMLLLNDAIVRLNEEIERYREMKGNPDEHGGVDMENDASNDKKNWMSSVQLWNTNAINCASKKHNSKSESKQRSEEEDDRSTCENPIQLCNYRSNRGEGFLPFKAITGFEGCQKEEKEVASQVTGLSLKIPVPELDYCNLIAKSNGVSQVKMQTKPQQQQQQQQQQQRQQQQQQQQQQLQQACKKQRRCWSPELHRRFIDALEQLGGCQVATPKQIRELMQVDSLTNDEVKSHLQKYRLHIRKLPASSSNPANGLCMTQDQCNNHLKPNASESKISATTGSAKGSDSMEAEDNDKSESHSWNGRHHMPGETD